MTITLNGTWACDSNILIYALDKDSRYYKQSRELFTLVKERRLDIVIAQQNILESINVLVHQYKTPLNKTVAAIYGLLSELDIDLVAPQSTTVQTCFHLFPAHQLRVDIFDYYLSATLIDNKITQLLTVNTKDFKYIKQLRVYNPFGED